MAPSKFHLPPFAGGYSKPSQARDVMAEGKGAKEEVKKVPCICGMCICGKHHCSVHHLPTNTLATDPKLKREYQPKSDYELTYTPREIRPEQVATRRGLAVAPRRALKPPSVPMDSTSITHQDFVEKPIYTVPRCSAKHNLSLPRGVFQKGTTYTGDYTQMDFDPNPIAPSLMRSTLPRIIEVQPRDGYVTTNQALLGDWRGDLRSKGYKEMQEPPFFVGDFQKETVTLNDFSNVAVEGGRPGTNCKKIEHFQVPEKDFSNITTTKTAYKLPQIHERGPVHLKGRSRVMEETMAPIAGKMSSLTQYREDNPGFTYRTSKRSMPPPLADSVRLFAGNLQDKSEEKTRYKLTNGAKHSVRHSRFGTYPPDRTTGNNAGINQTDYFKFWKLPQRTQYGDRCEHIYHPSKAKFDAESETKASYMPLDARPSEICKPLDLRFHREPPEYSHEFSEETAYRTDFVARSLPKVETCPAEMLQKA